jgi:glycosyltransferase involved in cell wall biosynthesis
MVKKEIWVIIPAYNESKHISDVIKKIKDYCENIIVIDDGSKDDTYELAKEQNVFVLKNIVNMGKGAALRTGCDFALQHGAKTIIVIDADGQHNPKNIPSLIKSLEGFDVLFTYRRFSEKMPFILRFGNWFISKFTSLLYGVKIKDTQCGFRAFTSEAYKRLRWQACDYSMESEMIANVGKNHMKYVQFPIETIYSDKYKGTTIIDGFKIVLNMIKFKLGG